MARGQDSPQSSGTGFIVSREGHVLTNNHVVDRCASIRTSLEGKQIELSVIGTDPKNDLAVIKLPHASSRVAQFREGRTVRSGDGLVVVGFPLHGVLASEANVTTGTISAMAGIGNDTRFIQLTAPVQPGNSGGPVLDRNGRVVGVVVSQMNALAMVMVTGDLPQNVNFAIKDAVAKAFLESHSIQYETTSSTKELGAAEIGEAAKRFTVLLECFSDTLDSNKRALEAERQAIKKEKRDLERARKALRTDQEERARIARQQEAAKPPAAEDPHTESLDLDKLIDEVFREYYSNPYFVLIQHRIMSFWSPPPLNLTDEAYVVVVQFRLHRSGRISGVAIKQSSGNEYYDLAGKRAVLSASPLPAVPADIANPLANPYIDTHMSFTVSVNGRNASFH